MKQLEQSNQIAGWCYWDPYEGVWSLRLGHGAIWKISRLSTGPPS